MTKSLSRILGYLIMVQTASLSHIVSSHADTITSTRPRYAETCFAEVRAKKLTGEDIQKYMTECLKKQNPQPNSKQSR